MKSRSTSSASDSSTFERVKLAKAVTRISAPSSSRIEFDTREAMNSSTSGGAYSRSWAAFFCRMAIRVSRSGGWMSASRPHSNRVRSRSSSVASCFGERSEVMTICLLALCSVLKVWKNSSWVRSRFSRNWMSSISRMSTSR